MYLRISTLALQFLVGKREVPPGWELRNQKIRYAVSGATQDAKSCLVKLGLVMRSLLRQHSDLISSNRRAQCSAHQRISRMYFGLLWPF